MIEHPDPSDNANSSVSPRTRPTPWLVWSGVASLVLAVVCVLMTLAETIAVFNRLAHMTMPKPADLAEGMSLALIPTIAAAPLGLLGIGLLLAGFIWRKPMD